MAEQVFCTVANMLDNLVIGVFILGSFLLILAIAGGGFKLFGGEFSNTINNVRLRIFSGILGMIFILVAFIDPTNIIPDTTSGTLSFSTTQPVNLTTIPPIPTNTLRPSQEAQQIPTGCVINITFPFVTIKSEPSIRSEDIIQASEGEHAVLAYERVTFAGEQQIWFQIADKGRGGWVHYQAMTMEKGAECP
jgi:hypothetical protein